MPCWGISPYKRQNKPGRDAVPYPVVVGARAWPKANPRTAEGQSEDGSGRPWLTVLVEGQAWMVGLRRPRRGVSCAVF